MELRTLKTLVAIAEHGSFAAAGDAIGLTQSAVSLHVKALEDELGVRLFDRGKRPPALTADGRALLDHARQILDLCKRVGDAFRPEARVGALDFGAVPTTLTGVLPPALQALRASQPGLLVRVSSGLSHELERRVAKGELDAALVSQPLQVEPGLLWQPVADEPLMVIAPADAGGADDRALLTSLPFIRFKRFAWAAQIIDAELRRRRIAVQPSMELDSLEGIAAMVAHGLGASIVPRRHMADPFPPGVRALPFGRRPVVRTLGLLRRPDNPRAPLIAAVYDELRRLCAEPAVA